MTHVHCDTETFAVAIFLFKIIQGVYTLKYPLLSYNLAYNLAHQIKKHANNASSISSPKNAATKSNNASKAFHVLAF